MSEKIIIESKNSNAVRIITVTIFVIGLIVFLIAMPDGRYGWGALTGGEWYSTTLRKYVPLEANVGYFFSSILPYQLGITFLPFLIVGALFFFANSKPTLTVTDKRIYGKVAFGKRVDLPFDMISAVGTSTLMGISVSTPSGAIKFNFIANREDIHKEIGKLLIARQSKSASATAIEQKTPQSDADELQKYKLLLENGTITQEEFDAKKKQLLGV